MYATRADIEALYGARHLETLVPSDVDFDTAVSNAIEAATAKIESYLRKRYAVPVATVPRALKHAAIDIACWKLAPATDRLSEEIARRAKAQIDWLKDVAAGKADIDELEPVAAGGVPGGTASDSGAFFASNARRFPRGGGLL